MRSNVEIKARLSRQQVEGVREKALALSSAPPELLHQTDTFYPVASGRLKLRELADGTAELIAYTRPDRVGPKLSSYVVCPCPTPGALHEALARSLGVRGVVTKARRVIHIGETRVHLDEVAGLGDFLELEVVLRPEQTVVEGEEVAARLLKTLEIESSALLEEAYIDLLEAAGA